MLSLLIINHDTEKSLKYAQKLCLDESINPLDCNILFSEAAIGIKEIRDIQKKIFLKPIKSSHKAIIIGSADTFTTEAQNALLKALEEPPLNTRIIIIAVSQKLFLPTILSRCKIILVPEKGDNFSQDDIILYTRTLTQLKTLTVSEKLKIAQNVSKNKSETLRWLNGIIAAVRLDITENTNAEIVEKLQETYKTASSTNVNLRFALEHLLLNF